MSAEMPLGQKRQTVEFVLVSPGNLAYSATGNFTLEELCFALDVLKARLLDDVKRGRSGATIRPEVVAELRSREWPHPA